jgi:hypothetical protein
MFAFLVPEGADGPATGLLALRHDCSATVERRTADPERLARPLDADLKARRSTSRPTR